jgi:hypothetical protein
MTSDLRDEKYYVISIAVRRRIELRHDTNQSGSQQTMLGLATKLTTVSRFSNRLGHEIRRIGYLQSLHKTPHPCSSTLSSQPKDSP